MLRGSGVLRLGVVGSLIPSESMAEFARIRDVKELEAEVILEAILK